VSQFVAMSHGKNYTVEEQVTGEAKHGGFQFDIFPRRDEPWEGDFYSCDKISRDVHPTLPNGIYLPSHMTPAELDIPLGGTVKMLPCV
jgi:hypothetical protein